MVDDTVNNMMSIKDYLNNNYIQTNIGNDLVDGYELFQEFQNNQNIEINKIVDYYNILLVLKK